MGTVANMQHGMKRGKRLFSREQKARPQPQTSWHTPGHPQCFPCHIPALLNHTRCDAPSPDPKQGRGFHLFKSGCSTHAHAQTHTDKQTMTNLMWIKQDETHEPECSHVWQWSRCRNTWICSHVEHFCETVCLNSLVYFPLLPYQCTIDCGIWKKVACKVWSVECRVWSVKYGV